MLDRHGPPESASPTSRIIWKNIPINSLIGHHNLWPTTPDPPQLIRIPIKIFDVNTYGLIDTGAATSLLSSKILFDLRNKIIKHHVNDEYTPVIRTVSGEELRSYGKFQFPVTINDNHMFEHNFYVVENMKEKCILGIDFLSQHNVKINTKNRQIDYDHGNAVQSLLPELTVYSLTIGESEEEIPLVAMDDYFEETCDQALRFTYKTVSTSTQSRECADTGKAQSEKQATKPSPYLPTNIRETYVSPLVQRVSPSQPSAYKDFLYPLTGDEESTASDTSGTSTSTMSDYDFGESNNDEFLEISNITVNNGKTVTRLAPKPIDEDMEEFDEENHCPFTQNIPVVDDHFNLEHLSKDDSTQLMLLLDDYEIVFSRSKSDIGLAIDVKHYINTGDSAPICMRARRIPESLSPKVADMIEEMKKSNVIRESCSPYAAPVVLVTKKDGTIRICLDYRQLNGVTVKNKFPLPRIDVTISKLFRAKYFSTLDLVSGYWQIEINEEDKHKTAFVCEFGLYEFNRMPFGLTNAPSTFQRAMNNIFRSILYKYVLVYLDDIIIYSETYEEHLQHLREVLKRVKKANLRLNKKKCEFVKREIEYLGYIISIDGIRPNEKKVEAIKNYPEPKNKKELASYLGIVSYYRQYVPNFAEKAHPLTALTKKNAKWKWDAAERDAFICTKSYLITNPILGFPDFTREFIIYTDASGYGVGAVLAQMQTLPHDVEITADNSTSIQPNIKKGEREVVIAYASRHLKDREAAWATVEKECYAIIYALKQFKAYIHGRCFTVITDHRPLQWLMDKKEPTGRLERWALHLQQYDLGIGYRQGKIHQNADCLSRTPKPDATIAAPIQVVEIEPQPGPSNATWFGYTDWKNEVMADLISRAAQDVLEARAREDQADSENRVVQEPVPTHIEINTLETGQSSSESNITVENKLSYWARLQRGDNYCQEIIELMEQQANEWYESLKVNEKRNIESEANRKGDHIGKGKSLIKKNGIKSEGEANQRVGDHVNSEADQRVGDHSNLNSKRNNNYNKWPNTNKAQRFKYNEKGEIVDLHNRLIVPMVKVYEILKENHDHMTAGHLGIAKTIARIKRLYNWRYLKQHVVSYIKQCLICAKRKAGGATKAPLRPMPPANEVWDRIAMDIVGPLTVSDNGFKYILVISDYASRFVFTIPMIDQKATTVAEHFVKEIICKYGTPKTVLTDQGTNFESKLIKNICDIFNINKQHTTAYHPQTDGLVERFNRTLGDMLASYTSNEPNEWDKYLPFVTLAYNSAIQSTVKNCPFYLFFGRMPTLPTDRVMNERYNIGNDEGSTYLEKWKNAKKTAKEQIFKAQKLQKEFYDKNAQATEYNIGDLVLLREPPKPGKFRYRWEGIWVIEKIFSQLNYKICQGKEQMVVHVNRLKKYNRNFDTEYQTSMFKRAYVMGMTKNGPRTGPWSKPKDVPIGVEPGESIFHEYPMNFDFLLGDKPDDRPQTPEEPPTPPKTGRRLQKEWNEMNQAYNEDLKNNDITNTTRLNKKFDEIVQRYSENLGYIKRGPGRPRKTPKTSTAELPLPDNRNITPDLPKRGPGRPRKNVEIPPSKDTNKVPVRKGPGRPRKNIQIPTLEPVENEPTTTQIRRGPGRPKKVQENSLLSSQAATKEEENRRKINENIDDSLSWEMSENDDLDEVLKSVNQKHNQPSEGQPREATYLRRGPSRPGRYGSHQQANQFQQMDTKINNQPKRGPGRPPSRPLSRPINQVTENFTLKNNGKSNECTCLKCSTQRNAETDTISRPHNILTSRPLHIPTSRHRRNSEREPEHGNEPDSGLQITQSEKGNRRPPSRPISRPIHYSNNLATGNHKKTPFQHFNNRKCNCYTCSVQQFTPPIPRTIAPCKPIKPCKCYDCFHRRGIIEAKKLAYAGALRY